ncbi:MAG: WG repeat-containing protein [Alistipes sp.]|nr:WG repeat-containing protein [Alistipes sp.]
MAPSIVSFSDFLLAESPSFKTLRGVVVIKSDNEPIINRTTHFAEALIEIDGRRALLCLPLSGHIESAVERVCIALNKHCSSALCEYRLLKGEISLCNSMGDSTPHDVILHALPEGERLDRAVRFVATSRLRAALALLKEEMLSIGFVHGNLKPSNLIFGNDGRLYPIRYNYAHLGASESEILEEMRSIETFLAGVPEVVDFNKQVLPTKYDSLLPYDELFPMQDMMYRVRKGDLYGYLNSNKTEVIAPQFTYAENFFENRAVVQTREGKMGVIDHNNSWIIEPVYEMLGIEGGIFNARIGEKWIKIDYMGNIIK